MFQHLSKDNLHSSTTILKPNVPGSTTLWLSWIWHNAHIRTGVFAEEIIGAHMFDGACTIQEFLNGCKSSADAALNANIRKATGCHALNELALLKELHAELRALALA
jgi:hypothetical protein